MSTDIAKLLIADTLSDEETEALVTEMRSQGATLDRLISLNYVTSLFPDDQLEVVRRRIAGRDRDARNTDRIDTSRVGWLTSNNHLQMDNLATGLTLGSYAITLRPERYGGISTRSPIDFVKIAEGQKAPELGNFTCRLYDTDVSYDVNKLSVLDSIGTIVEGLNAGIVGVNLRMPVATMLEIYASLEGRELSSAKAIKVSDLPKDVGDLVTARVTTAMTTSGPLTGTDDYGYRRNRFESHYSGAFTGLGLAGGKIARGTTRSNVSAFYNGSKFKPSPPRRRSEADFNSWTKVVNALGMDSEALFHRAKEEWLERRGVRPNEIDDTLLEFTSGSRDYCELALSSMTGFSRTVLGTGFSAVRNAMRVLTVHEEGPYRVALLEGFDFGRSGVYPAVVLVSGDQPLWGCLDEGNILLPSGLTIEPGIDWTAAGWAMMHSTYINQLGSGRITPDWYRRTVLPELRRQQITITPQQQRQLKQERLTAKFQALAEGKRDTLTCRDIAFTQGGMKFQDVDVTIPPEPLKPWLATLNPTSIENVEFNDVMDSCFKGVLNLASDGTPNGGDHGVYYDFHNRNGDGITFVINEITAVVTYNETARGHARILINGKRVNKAEVTPILMRIMCFRDQAQFDAFVGNVSKCSLRIMGHISDGLEFPVNLGFGHASSTGLISLRRVKGKNYIVLPAEKTEENPDGEELVKISSINKLIALKKVSRSYNYSYGGYGANSVQQVQQKLREAAPTLTANQIRTLMQSSIRTWLMAVAKSKVLLEKTLERFDVKLVSNPLSNLSGPYYKVPGKSGNTYYIKNDQQLAIYNAGGGHICIVDKGAAMSQTVGRDRLVARIFAVAMDTQTVQDIHTLRGYVKN
jgi:hypothetical protein